LPLTLSNFHAAARTDGPNGGNLLHPQPLRGIAALVRRGPRSVAPPC